MTKSKPKKELTPNRVVCCVLGCGSERADRILKKIGPRSSELVAAYDKGTARSLLQQLRAAADSSPGPPRKRKASRRRNTSPPPQTSNVESIKVRSSDENKVTSDGK